MTQTNQLKVGRSTTTFDPMAASGGQIRARPFNTFLPKGLGKLFVGGQRRRFHAFAFIVVESRLVDHIRGTGTVDTGLRSIVARFHK